MMYERDEVTIADQEFFKLCEQGDLEAIKACVRKGQNISVDGDNGLCYALDHGHLEVVKYLLDEGADLEYVIKEWEMLVNVVAQKRIEVLDFLLKECMVDMNASGGDVMEEAISTKDTKFLDYLVEYGLLLTDGPYYCSWSNQLDMLRYIVERYNCDPHLDDEKPLRTACRFGHIDIVRYLVENCNANVTVFDNEPIRLAKEKGHENVVQFLLVHGASLPVVIVESKKKPNSCVLI